MGIIDSLLTKARDMGGDNINAQLINAIYKIMVKEQKEYNKSQGATQAPVFVLFKKEAGGLEGHLYATSGGSPKESTAGPAKIKAVKLDDILKNGLDRMTLTIIKTATGKSLEEIGQELEKAILYQLQGEAVYLSIFFKGSAVMLATCKQDFKIVNEINFKNII